MTTLTLPVLTTLSLNPALANAVTEYLDAAYTTAEQTNLLAGNNQRRLALACDVLRGHLRGAATRGPDALPDVRYDGLGRIVDYHVRLEIGARHHARNAERYAALAAAHVMVSMGRPASRYAELHELAATCWERLEAGDRRGLDELAADLAEAADALHADAHSDAARAEAANLQASARELRARL